MIAPEGAGLPRRDLVVLPLIALATALLLLACIEGVTHLVWPEQKSDRCDLPIRMRRPLPNCSSRVKAAEGPWVPVRTNECGYRATGPCRAVPAGPRLAVIGSSVSWGHLVPFADVWSSQVADAARRRCGTTVDVQSLGGFGDLNAIYGRIGEVLALHPQQVALVVTPFDLLKLPTFGFDPAAAARSGTKAGPNGNAVPGPAPSGPIGRVTAALMGSRAATVAQNYLYRNAEGYVSAYLNYGDKADFLRPPFTPRWRMRIEAVDRALAAIQGRLRPAGIPLSLIYVPQQAQADVIAGRLHPPHVDAMALNRALATAARSNGATFVDGAAAFATVDDAPVYFYRADGHINGTGQRLLGQAAAAVLVNATGAPLCRAGRA